MSSNGEIVFVVDDDIRVREAIGELLESMGWRAETFATAADYVAYAKPDTPAYLWRHSIVAERRRCRLFSQASSPNHTLQDSDAEQFLY
jgi:DNA-binding NtrC family response regulator